MSKRLRDKLQDMLHSVPLPIMKLQFLTIFVARQVASQFAYCNNDASGVASVVNWGGGEYSYIRGHRP